MSAWKDFERRCCRALGAERRGPDPGSDDDGSAPFALECKRTTRYQLRGRWVEQARRQGKTSGRPWLLVIGQHNDRRPIAVLDFAALVQLAYEAGRIEAADVVHVSEAAVEL